MTVDGRVIGAPSLRKPFTLRDIRLVLARLDRSIRLGEVAPRA